MGFKLIHWLYIIITLGIYCDLFSTRNMSDRFNKGLIIKNPKLKKLLWMRNNEYISFVSIIFLIISYLILVGTIACFLICLFVSNLAAKWITGVLFGVVSLVFFIEGFFLPPYGVRGS